MALRCHRQDGIVNARQAFRQEWKAESQIAARIAYRLAMSERPFLDVARSFRGQPWRARLDEAGERLASAICQTHGLAPMLARIIAARGIAVDGVESFLDPKLRDLMPDPSRLIDMDKAAERLADALIKHEPIAIFGDYDVDGACASALLAGYCKAMGAPFRIHIPDRILEGYGPNNEAISMLAEEGASLLVCVDCGTTSHAALAHARQAGLETIVLDHHQAPSELPAAHAIVNPNRQDDLSGMGMLCAAGVVFLTLVATGRTLRARGMSPPDLMNELDIVALATVADVVPLIGLNRAFVRNGLTIIRRRSRMGLSALMDAARLNSPAEAYHLGFLLGPRINAGGRIGDAALGSRLLVTDNKDEALRIAAELDRLNAERQGAERAMVEEAVAAAEMEIGPAGTPPAALVLASPSFHPGIVGLIASRVKDRFQRPVFAFALREDGTATGSGRSVAGADLGLAVRRAAEQGLLIKGGGHAMAAGATIEAARLGAFETYLREALGSDVASAEASSGLMIDSILTAGGATPDLFQAMERAGPFGQGAPEPVFVFASHEIAEAQEIGEARHIRLKLKSGDGRMIGAIAFRAGGEDWGARLLKARGTRLNIAATLTRDQWGGREKIEARVIDASEI
jgi:single-stranded-DNA-specific exonuclease